LWPWTIFKQQKADNGTFNKVLLSAF